MTIHSIGHHSIADLISAVALLCREGSEGWQSHGPVGDQIQQAFVDFEGERYTIVRDDGRAVLVFSPPEWDAFVDGVARGEFDKEAGLAPPTVTKEKST